MPYSFNYNGNIYPSGSAVIHPDNRALLTGEGLIETMLWETGHIKLWEYHFKRLCISAETLNIDIKTLHAAFLLEEIRRTVAANKCASSCVIRLEVFRYGTESNNTGFLLECRMVPARPDMPVVGIARSVIKAADSISHIKSTSRLVYTKAMNEASERGWNDALLLNQYGRIAESTICNILWAEEGRLYTPPLSEGCIAGVFRQYLSERANKPEERILTPDSLAGASAIFLCNAIRGIFPVRLQS